MKSPAVSISALDDAAGGSVAKTVVEYFAKGSRRGKSTATCALDNVSKTDNIAVS